MKEYEQLKTETENSIWHTEDTLFINNKLPEKYKNESAVILAKCEKTFTQKKGDYINLILITSDRRKILTTHTIREKIFINDQASLKEFSELEYNKLISRFSGKGDAFFSSDYAYSFIGIRLIKPNGIIKNINIEEASILVGNEEGLEKNKVAIPGLEISDVIDYYISVTTKISQDYVSKVVDDTIVFESVYPILRYSYSLEMDKNYGASYFRFNNAPAFDLIYNEKEGSILLCLNLEDIKKNKEITWSSKARTKKSILLTRFLDGGNAYGLNIQKSKVYDLTNNSAVKSERKRKTLEWNHGCLHDDGKSYNKYLEAYRKLYNDLEKYVKTKYKINIKNISGDKIINLMLPMLKKTFYLDRYISKSRYPIDPRSAIFIQSDENYENAWVYLMNRFCQKYNIKSRILIAENRYNQEFNEVIDANSECKFILEIQYNGESHYLSFENGFVSWDVIPHGIDGNPAKFYSFADSKKAEMLESGDTTIKLLSLTENSEFNNYIVNTSTSNPSKIELKRIYVGKGKYKIAKQGQLELIQYYHDEVMKELQLDNDILAYYASLGKEYKKSVGEFEGFLKKDKEKHKELIEKEATDQFANKPKEVKSFTILKHGIQSKDTTFEMEEELVLDGLIKKAGNNYLFEIGKLLGSQIEIKPEDHVRKEDVYMPYPRQFIYKIQFTIPEGFSCEGVDKLNVKIENETGGFTSLASVNGNLLSIDIKKYYSNGYEPAANWPKMTAFLDACFEFTKVKLLLKKK